MKSNEINTPLNERMQKVVDTLNNLGISFEIHFHPPIPTIEEAMRYWQEFDSTHCKNLFFRNHKGNQHYLVFFECHQQMQIHELEKILRQGKLTFASPQRMEKYLGLLPGSVSPFGLINDETHHVKVFIDKTLKEAPKLSFHPNDNTATIVIDNKDFFTFLDAMGNHYEFIDLFEDEIDC